MTNKIIKIKKGDFIQLNFSGSIDAGIIFDTNIEEIAKKNQLYNEKSDYKPLIVCIGEGQVVKGLDKDIEGKTLGKYNVSINADEAFGKKRMDLLTLVPVRKFKQQKIKPYPGLSLEIDKRRGVVKMVSGGRVIVDFNHPLASKNVTYDYEIIKLVKNKNLQVQSVLGSLGIKQAIKVENNKTTIKLDIPEEIKKLIVERVKKLTNVSIVFEK